MNLRTLNIIIKITERCNLSCTYCYFFNGVNRLYKEHRPYIKDKVINDIKEFIIKSLFSGIKQVNIILHGGEPLLIGKERFVRLVKTLSISEKISFTIQTNATLIDKEWAEIFSKMDIHVGVSIDGEKEVNDKYRIYPNGKGSFEKIINGVKILKKHNIPASIISVINFESNPSNLYNLIFNELGIYSFNFLPLDINYETISENQDYLNLRFFDEMFDLWISLDKKPNIRYIRKIINRFAFLSKKEAILGDEKSTILTINSDGMVSPNDEIMNCDISLFEKNNLIYISDLNLEDFCKNDPTYDIARFSSPKVCQECEQRYECNRYIIRSIPRECRDCQLKFICKGQGIGNIGTKFSLERKFENKTVYCELNKRLYRKAIKYLLLSGFDQEVIVNLTTLDDSEDHKPLCGIYH